MNHTSTIPEIIRKIQVLVQPSEARMMPKNNQIYQSIFKNVSQLQDFSRALKNSEATDKFR